MRTRSVLAVALLALAAWMPSIHAAGARTFAVEPDRSRTLIDVGKAGAFSFAGHTHEVEAPVTSGVVRFDADDASHDEVRLEFNAAAMRVTGKGESASDVPKVTATMLSDMVLDASRFPTIVFTSTGVTARGTGPALDLVVTGNLTIHGQTRPVTVPVAVKVSGDLLTATGRFVVRQTDYGITPISVGGVVKVKNELNISFEIAARER